MDEKVLELIRHYDGPELRFMEVCGTHTGEISRTGIRRMLSPKIRLISGPGCPVCVTVTAYIDKCIEVALKDNTTLVTFGDMLRVPGSKMSLREAQSLGALVSMVYSPLDMLKLAQKEPERTFVFAAVGFETTTPVYAMLLEEAEKLNIKNIRLLTSLKVMPPVIDWVCDLACNTDEDFRVDGFLAPGHVSVITGSRIFEPLAEKYRVPFVVSGFEGEELLAAIYALVRLSGQGKVMNMYPKVVTAEGNTHAQQVISKYFEPGDASWRGMGTIPGSGMYLKKEYERYDAGSFGLDEDKVANKACRCADVLIGRIESEQCPLFGKTCTVDHPQGACMVSSEGSCYTRFTEACR